MTLTQKLNEIGSIINGKEIESDSKKNHQTFRKR